MNLTQKTYFPNLDGLRFFAFFAVFVNHAAGCLGFNYNTKSYEYVKHNFLMNGDIGVGFFFVLSGFLITYLLLKEKETSGKINIKNFYIRRVLRIWPLYFLVVVLCLFVFPRFNNHLTNGFPIDVTIHHLNPWLYVLFAGNFDYIINGITSNVMLGVLWSVSIEEQFYLFWPLVIAFIPTKHLLKILIIIIAGAIVFRYFYGNGRIMIIKFHSFSLVSDLATGALLALLSTKEGFINRIKRIPKYAIVFTYIIGFAIIPLRLYLWKFGIHYELVSSFAPIVFSTFFAFIIMEQNYANHSFYKISKSVFISSLGKYTYGMYCYHMIVFFGVLFFFQLMGISVTGISTSTFVCVVITSLFTTFLVSTISYHYFEMKFLNLKNKFISNNKK